MCWRFLVCGTIRYDLETRYPSLRGAKRRSNPVFLVAMDCFASLAMTSAKMNSPIRGALHGGLALGVGNPQLHAVIAGVGVDREFAALEQWLHAAIAEFLRRLAAMKFRRQLDDKTRLQRAVEDQAGIALDLGDIVAVVMDAVAVEGQRRIAKQQHGVSHVAFAVLRGRRRHRWFDWRGCWGGRHIPIDNILPLADGGSARRRDEVFDRYETQYAAAA